MSKILFPCIPDDRNSSSFQNVTISPTKWTMSNIQLNDAVLRVKYTSKSQTGHLLDAYGTVFNLIHSLRSIYFNIWHNKVQITMLDSFQHYFWAWFPVYQVDSVRGPERLKPIKSCSMSLNLTTPTLLVRYFFFKHGQWT